MTANNDQLADVILRAETGDLLTDVFRYFENVHYQYRVGLYDDHEFERQKIAWGNYMNGSARVPKIWCEYQHVVSAEFAVGLNALLNKGPCD
jgi:hypothetical protein